MCLLKMMAYGELDYIIGWTDKPNFKSNYVTYVHVFTLHFSLFGCHSLVCNVMLCSPSRGPCVSTRVWKKCGIPNPGKCQTVLRNVSLHCVASGHLTCLYIQSYINCVKHMIILSWSLNMHKS